MQALRQECITENYFLIPQPKHMLWVLKRTVSMRRLFSEHTKHMFKLIHVDMENNNLTSTLISKRICVFTQINYPKRQLELNR